MMGGLHIEMASLKMLGKRLTSCGWSEIMYSAGVATQGIAESFLTASHVVNTVSCFEELGNPFTEESENLMAIHTKDIMDDSVCQRKIH